MHYRVRQFYESITANFRRLDEDFLLEHLTKNQLVLFLRLSKSDAHHAIRVARAMLAKAPEGLGEDYARLGLLHDIGKVERPLALPEKVAAVLLHKMMKGNLARYGKVPFIDSYLHHPERGRKILEGRSVFPAHPELYSVVSDHHGNLREMLAKPEPGPAYREALIRLKEADDRN
jgi:hypothetical protein